MGWKLLNKLFGYDYIAWNNHAASGVARVQKDGNGIPYYFRYKNICLTDRITSAEQVIWLTCSSEKYLKE